ncbi:MAG: hypothetical protein DWI57_14680 [Chloroflexi bacterium]|nr:MAG: hypothetical protein DWI57_14680 [Chloroflexota bacterium]
MGEVIQRFGDETGKRALVTQRLLHIYDLARRTGHLGQFIVFGSYVSTKTAPNDVDVILVMKDSFVVRECPRECAGLFDHAIAQARYGASIFWVRPGAMLFEPLDEFIAAWQAKRDGSLRGIVEVIEEVEANDDSE